jgi:hypothetical protein
MTGVPTGFAFLSFLSLESSAKVAVGNESEGRLRIIMVKQLTRPQALFFVTINDSSGKV